MSLACCALSAKFRWCLTGTPYQNTADDVYSLVKFLQIPPFAEWDYWKERISSPAKNERMSLALMRLRTLLRAIMIRRTKDTLKVCQEGGGVNDRKTELFSLLRRFSLRNWNSTRWSVDSMKICN